MFEILYSFIIKAIHMKKSDSLISFFIYVIIRQEFKDEF